MASTFASTASAGLSNRQRSLAILKASSGNLLEWAGFYFFAYCMMYFAPAFFPNGNATTQLMHTTGIFAAAFIARPIGGWFYGRLADRQGRRAALVHSGVAMLMGSTLLAAIPTYATVGYFAPVLLLLARSLQGFSVGGAYGASATYMSEVAIKNQRGFLASFQYTTLIGGQVIAILMVATLQQLLTNAQMMNWGWRIPFTFGAVGALISVYLRLSLEEGTAPQRKNKPSSTLKALLNYKKELVTVFITTAAGSTCFYTFTVYMQKYLVNSLGTAPLTASLMLAGALMIAMCLQPVFGALSDRTGRFMPMVLFSGLMMASALPIFYGLTHTSNLYAIFALMMLALTILTFYTSIAGIIKVELFPAHIRGLAVGFSYGVANAMFGGSTEYLAYWLKSMNMEFVFYLYIPLLCCLSLITCVAFLPAMLKMNYLENNNS